jgi:hypothetical protein
MSSSSCGHTSGLKLSLKLLSVVGFVGFLVDFGGFILGFRGFIIGVVGSIIGSVARIARGSS